MYFLNEQVVLGWESEDLCSKPRSDLLLNIRQVIASLFSVPSFIGHSYLDCKPFDTKTVSVCIVSSKARPQSQLGPLCYCNNCNMLHSPSGHLNVLSHLRILHTGCVYMCIYCSVSYRAVSYCTVRGF